jgi:DNA-binding CsgD family transcriptional regulator
VREIEILALISEGFSNKNIARMLKISPETVNSHVKRIFLKLAVSTRAAAACRMALIGAYDSLKPSEEKSDRVSVGAGKPVVPKTRMAQQTRHVRPSSLMA